MKKTLLYTSAAVLFGLLVLLFAILSILSLLPKSNALGLEMREYASVSPSSLGNGKYAMQIFGEVINQGDAAVALSSVEITVGNGKAEETVTVDVNITLQPRTACPITAELTGDAAYDRVLSVRAVGNGEAVEVSNQATGLFTPWSLMLLCCLAIAVFCLIHFAKQRYYIAQEAHME